jgi:hypothetical protein
MMIQVVYQDNRYDYVKGFVLDDLIESRQIRRFRRKDGWATIGVDPLRAPGTNHSFSGIERRASVTSTYPVDIKL